MTKYTFAALLLGAIMMIASTFGLAASRAETVAAAAESFLNSLDETRRAAHALMRAIVAIGRRHF